MPYAIGLRRRNSDADADGPKSRRNGDVLLSIQKERSAAADKDGGSVTALSLKGADRATVAFARVVVRSSHRI